MRQHCLDLRDACTFQNHIGDQSGTALCDIEISLISKKNPDSL
jgi:hypothetical protein